MTGPVHMPSPSGVSYHSGNIEISTDIPNSSQTPPLLLLKPTPKREKTKQKPKKAETRTDDSDSMERDDDSDAPEELTAQQGIEQEEEIRKVHKQNKMRVTQEGKERRRVWEQRKTQQSSARGGAAVEVSENKLHQETQDTLEMLPNDIVNLLASREKQVFHFDSEDETTNDKPTPKKKKLRNFGDTPVILKDIPPAECLHNSMDFLKKRKMKVPRSASVLKNSNQALRLLSTHGLLRNN